MSKKSSFDFMGIRSARTVCNEEISDDSFIPLVYEEGVSENLSAVDRSITRQDFGVDISKDHFRRAAVVPVKQSRPYCSFVIKQGTKVSRGKVPEVEDLHGAPEGWPTGSRMKSLEPAAEARKPVNLRCQYQLLVQGVTAATR